MNNKTDIDIVSVCANCGKGEEDSDKLKACTACKLVKYCSRECQIAHRPQHKMECRKRAAELHDEKLFTQQIIDEDCPICFIRIPFLHTGKRYMTCCGKEICSGCFYAPVYDNQGNIVTKKSCPFCRTPTPTSEEEATERLKKRVEAGDAIAIHNLGLCHQEGSRGYSQNYDKALELWHRAVDLGNTDAYCDIAVSYNNGLGVEVDKKKTKYYYELAASRGCVMARRNLGTTEEMAGNMSRALKHFMIAVRSGQDISLSKIKDLYSNGRASKEDYTKALQSYQTYLSEIKNVQRDKAAAAGDDFRYY